MARGMVEVELVGDEPPPGDPGPDPTERLRRAWAAGVRGARRAAAFVGPRLVRAWRRPRVRWVAGGVAVTLVAVPVAVHQVDAAHERARLAALAQVPGVVPPLHPGLRATFQLPGPDSQALWGGAVVGDSVVAAVSPQEGDWSIVGLDTETGARRWSTSLQPVDAPVEKVEYPSCEAAGALVLCAARQVADAAGHAWRTSTWVLDPADGHVVRAASYDDHTWAHVANGLIVLARQSSGPRRAPAAGPWVVTWEVTASDPATGAVAWTWTGEPVTVAADAAARDDLHDPADYSSSFSWASRSPTTIDVVLTVGDDTWVLGPNGSQLTHVARPGGWQVREERGSLLRMATPSAADGIPAVELLTDDGSWKPVDSNTVDLTVDDGSAPDLLLRTSDSPPVGGNHASVLSAVDRHTGATLWQAQVDTDGFGFNAALLDGHVYVGGRTLQAIDLATGRVSWGTDEATGSLVATDGLVLLVMSSNDEVAARSLRDGRLMWREDLSAGALPWDTGNLAGLLTNPTLGVLTAWGQDGSAAVLG